MTLGPTDGPTIASYVKFGLVNAPDGDPYFYANYRPNHINLSRPHVEGCGLSQLSNRQHFTCSLPDEKLSAIPLAQITSIDLSNRTVSFQLDRGVEVFPQERLDVEQVETAAHIAC